MIPGPIGGIRVAFFGGSFDPPHLGHLAVARAAQQTLHLDRVLFAPVGLQPLKPTGSSAPFEDRVAMTRLAIASDPGFEVSLLDAPSPHGADPAHTTPHYTVDTLTRLSQSLPSDACLYLLIGADSFRTIHHWHRASEIPFLAGLIVASRPGEDLSDLASFLPKGIALQPIPNRQNQYLLSNSSGAESHLTLLPDLNYDISATQLRNQIHGQPANEPTLLDPAVLQYIHRHHLYESTTP
jgi:nicotinate-nucleotide adenylyltransferase